MFTLCALGIGVLAVANGANEPSSAPRLFLVLGESSLDIVDGRAEIGRIPIKRKWDPSKKRDVETINDAQFVIDKAFWQMVDRNSTKYGARDEVRITNAHKPCTRTRRSTLEQECATWIPLYTGVNGWWEWAQS